FSSASYKEKKKSIHFSVTSEEAAGSEKADAEGSSDEDEGALVIDEKNDRGGNKRKADESAEVSPKRPKDADAEGASDVDNAKTEGKVNDVAAPEENTAAPGKQMADKVNCCQSATALEMAVNRFCIYVPPCTSLSTEQDFRIFCSPPMHSSACTNTSICRFYFF
uniref:Uncharacterized protein n=1 Tax=Hippocampus comes TaxID=109280 RepID=A0A3Q3D4G0_HIPCM